MKKFMVILGLVLVFTMYGGKTFAEEPLPQAFLDALADTAVAERSEIVRTLVDITPENPDLIYKDIEGKTHILVASLVSGTFYDGYPEDGLYDQSHPKIWVTVVPELKNFFADQVQFPDDLYQRIIKLMGFRPEEEGEQKYTRVVELWVQPEDLIRPCPDPEITDREAELDFPALVKEYSPDFYLANDWDNGGAPLLQDWQIWVEGNKNYDSEDPWAYPWTRLGYTYDWGDEEDHVGLSEFILQSDAAMYVHSVQSVDVHYFATPAGAGSSGGSGGCNSFTLVGFGLLLVPLGMCFFKR